jgi:galactitol-specific phosphotransferase system IIB component
MGHSETGDFVMENFKLMDNEELIVYLNEDAAGAPSEEEEAKNSEEKESTESDEKTSETVSTSSESQSGSTKKSEFSFDREKYEAQGIKDDLALAELEKKEKQIWEKEQFIGRQSNNVGNLRKKEEEYVEKIRILEQEKQEIAKNLITKEEFDNISLDSPFEASQRLQLSQESQKRQQELTNQQTQHLTAMENYKAVPDLDQKVDAIVAVMKEDGLADTPQGLAIIEDFKRNPGTMFHASMTVQLSKRADLLVAQQKLQQQIEDAQNKSKANVDRMKSLHKQNPTVSTGSSGAEKKQGPTNPKFMTDKELEEIFNG